MAFVCLELCLMPSRCKRVGAQTLRVVRAQVSVGCQHVKL
jgi:hypothetical protein